MGIKRLFRVNRVNLTECQSYMQISHSSYWILPWLQGYT